MTKKNIDEELPIEKTFENIIFNDENKNYEFEIFIPDLIESLSFRFDCEITNSKGENINLNYEQDSDFVKAGHGISDGFFRKCGKKYFYEDIGRNGENITSNAGEEKKIQLYTNYFEEPISLIMKYDKEGKLNLGELKDINRIEICEYNRYGKFIYNLTNYSKYCYPERIDIIEGESFSLPFYSRNNEINLDDNYFILYETFKYEGNPIRVLDIKNEIILNKLS